MLLLVLSSVGGAVIGAIVGGFLESYADVQWLFWVPMIIGIAIQVIHFCVIPETRSSILLDREAKWRRQNNQEDIYGPNELEPRLSIKKACKIWLRPFEMLIFEPIVLWLSLLSGFSDAIIFTFLDSFGMVYQQWGFHQPRQVALTFLPLLLSYIISYLPGPR